MRFAIRVVLGNKSGIRNRKVATSTIRHQNVALKFTLIPVMAVCQCSW